MKNKGKNLVALGVLGVIGILLFDIILKKPVYNISGPKSITGFIICGILIIAGLIFLKKK
ncbi:MAG: hypothetical protein KKH08_01950 [Candidatus Omnitrophica bacterium]|nr:hypothetical protein [Candidatus Omnitrophota bacterium]